MIKSGNIVLRAPVIEDLDIMYIWENDMDNWILSNAITPFSKDFLADYLNSYSNDIFSQKQLRLMIEVNDILIGCIDIFDFDPHNSRAGIGILIAEKEYRNIGVGDKVLKMVLDYSFNTLLLNQLYCNILSDNIPSLKLFKKNGFVEVGTKTQWVKTNCGYKDEILLQLLNGKGKSL